METVITDKVKEFIDELELLQVKYQLRIVPDSEWHEVGIEDLSRSGDDSELVVYIDCTREARIFVQKRAQERQQKAFEDTARRTMERAIEQGIDPDLLP